VAGYVTKDELHEIRRNLARSNNIKVRSNSGNQTQMATSNNVKVRKNLGNLRQLV
jgi:hypothetical protein